MKIELREWENTDLDELVINANNISIAKNLRNTFPNPYTKKDGEFFINLCKNANRSRELLLAIVVDNKAAGSIGITLKNDINCKCAELGYWLGVAYWGRGIASEAVKMICKKGFEEYDIIRIFAEVFEYNIASQKVLEKCGFLLEGRFRKSIYKDGEIFDSMVFGLVK